MSRKTLAKSQQPKAKSPKPKVVKWEYVTKPFDVKVLPSLITRLHSPLTPWLSSLTENCYVHLRPCVQGVDEDGAVVKYLYCTRNGRFFVRGKEGWNEILPNTASGKKGHSDHRGTTGCPRMRDYGAKPAHRCVAVAWCNPPEYVKATINNKNAKRIYEVDHLNTDHKNWTADNLQWVTPDENRRRGAIAKLMRLIGLDPKLLTPTLMRGIFGIHTLNVIFCLNKFKEHCNSDWSQLSVEAIRLNFAKALDDTKEKGIHWVTRPGCKKPTTRDDYRWLMKKIKAHKERKTTKQQKQ
jgi:hypothetical protein